MSVLLFILCLVALIVAHEFGHFVVAKFFDIRVDEFGVFFPPRIFAFKKGGTEYSLNWLPFGGFVKIFGEDYDEGAADPRSFVNKNRLVQAAVLVAGVAFNVVVAWLLLSAGYMAGLPTSAQHEGFGTVLNPQATIVEVLPGSPADAAGLMPGDVVSDVQTGTASLSPNSSADQVTAFIGNHQDESVIFMVERDGVRREFLAKPAEGLVPGKKAVGIELDDVGTLKLNPVLALAQGAVLSWDITQSTAVNLGHFFATMFEGRADLSQVSGPIGITAFGAATIRQGFAASVVLIALISINLALLNLLPVPGLDGGRLLIVAVEGVTRRRVPAYWVNWLTLAGLALLILLMLVVSFHDITKLVG
jgi:regulator of sigma E protease